MAFHETDASVTGMCTAHFSEYRLDCIGKKACNSVKFKCEDDPSLCSVMCERGTPACVSLTVRAWIQMMTIPAHAASLR